MGSDGGRRNVRAINQVLLHEYGMDFVNAKKVIDTKMKQKRPNPDGLSLAQRILMNRRKSRGQAEQQDSASGSVDISELTNPKEDRRTPTPEPTVNNRRKSPPKRQNTYRNLANEPGPSNKRTPPPLPPITPASPRRENKHNGPKKQSSFDSRRDTPVLPPIARKETPPNRQARVTRRQPSRVSHQTDDGIDEVRPPKDRREFDPNLGVGDEPRHSPPTRESPPHERSMSPEQRTEIPTRQKSKTPTVDRRRTPVKEQFKAETPKPVRPETQKQMSPHDVTTVVPVVAAAAGTTSRPRSRSRSRSRSKERARSRSRSRSRERKKSRSRRSRSRSPRRRTKSHRSRSRKRYRSTSYSDSSSPRRRRRSYSPSPRRRHRSRGRSRSRRNSFEYDFHRAKSLVRSLSCMRSLSRPRYRSPSIEYKILGGPTPRSASPRRKKQIIIVQNDGVVTRKKRRNRSTSDSDVNVIVTSSKRHGRKGRSRKVSDSESDSSERSRSKSKKRKNKKNIILKTYKKKSESDSDDSDSDSKGKLSKSKDKKKMKTKKKVRKGINNDSETGSSADEVQKTKNLRFDLDNVQNRRFSDVKPVKVDAADTPEPEVDLARKPNFANAPLKPAQRNEELADASVQTNLGTPSTLSSRGSSRNKTPLANAESPLATKSTNNTPTPRNIHANKENKVDNEEKELLDALEQLEKRSDFELEQLKGGNQRKLPPDVNLQMKKKIFSRDFQRSIDNFLET